MTISKKLIEFKKLMKKSDELISKLEDFNNNVDESELSNSITNSKKISKNYKKTINDIMKEFTKTHKKIYEISSTFTADEKEKLKKLNLN